MEATREARFVVIDMGRGGGFASGYKKHLDVELVNKIR